MLIAEPIEPGSSDPPAASLLRLAAADPGRLGEALAELVASAGRAPGSHWLALVLGTRDEVAYAVELCATAPDPVAPRRPPGIRAGALLTLAGDDAAIPRLVEGLAAGHQRLTLLLVAAGGDLEAARALLLVGEPGSAGARAQLSLLARGSRHEAVLQVPRGVPAPTGLPRRGSRSVAAPEWLTETPQGGVLGRRRAPLAAERRPPGETAQPLRRAEGGVETDGGAGGRRGTVAGLPRPLAAAAAAALLASLVLTGVVVARHASDRAPVAATAVASPGASAAPFGQGDFVDQGGGFPLARGPYQLPSGITPGASAPLPRTGAASAVDQSTGRLVLFGGTGTIGGSGGGLLSDTWERGAAGWLAGPSTPAPPAAAGDPMGWDPVGRRLVLLTQASPSTWAYSGEVWTQLHPPHEPPACPGSMAVEPDSGRLHLLVTCSGARGVMPPELWSWSGADWQHLEVSGAPAAAWPATLVIDPGGRTLLMAVTFSAAAGGPLELWRLTGSAWAPTGHPPAGWGPLGDSGPPLLLSDPADHLVVAAQTAGGSWAWDGTTWGRPAGTGSAAGPDWIGGWGTDSTGHLMVAGGALSSGDTSGEWTFGPSGWTAVSVSVIG